MKKKHKYLIIFSATSMLLLQGCSVREEQPKQPETISESTLPPSEEVQQEEVQQEQVAAPEEISEPEEIQRPLSALISTTDLAPYFEAYDNATMLLSDGDSFVSFNEPFAKEEHSPYSTFKIPNSLIALEEGVVSIEDSLKEWDGIEHSRMELNQDQDLASAMKHSCVWYYKELAKEIGADAMQNHLNLIGYGNKDISGGIDTFWLGSTLLISPHTQIDFIMRLYNNELHFSQENMDYVKSIMRQEDYPIELYGKTGSSGNGEGWFVGYAIFDEKPYYFASYIEGEEVSGLLVRDVIAQILDDFLSEPEE